MTIPTPEWNFTHIPQEELLRLKNDCEIPDMPTQMTYHLRRAVSGGGTYKDFVPFVEEILDACKEHPKANVRTWI